MLQVHFLSLSVFSSYLLFYFRFPCRNNLKFAVVSKRSLILLTEIEIALVKHIFVFCNVIVHRRIVHICRLYEVHSKDIMNSFQQFNRLFGDNSYSGAPNKFDDCFKRFVLALQRTRGGDKMLLVDKIHSLKCEDF